ncbi:hypothetical protein FSP39_025338 [Pinctada imbricata]|uniref:Uncharacterized protein n=1 Tax=Pinctada imbricata TaxID=66713 RepID=A0AA88YGL0_PINIB|nr:hypothetical protein FSP39_025338 [Pinctada imbricata]
MFRKLVVFSVVAVILSVLTHEVLGWQYSTFQFPYFTYRWCRRYKDKICDVVNFKDMTGADIPMYCGDGQCGGVEYSVIERMYKDNDKRRSSDLYSDWDKCCATQHMFVEMPEYLQNTDGQNRTLVHFPEKGQYQAVHIGTCDTTPMECDDCRQIKKLVMLLVIDPSPTCWPPLMYDVFEVDGYCSCTNLGS